LRHLRLRVLSKISLGLVFVIAFFFSTIGVSQEARVADEPTKKPKPQAEPKGVTLKLPDPPKPKVPGGTLPYQTRRSGNLSLGIRKLRSYAQREKITLELIVKNRGSRKASLLFPSAKEFDFVVTDGKSAVWRWGSDKVFARVRKMRSLAPDDSLHFEVTWDQLKADGTYCNLGNYKVIGILETAKPDSTPWAQLGIVD
jgi:hypothetical protein